MNLQLLISTIGREGILRAASVPLPPMPNVSYIVGWQMPEGEVPESLRRDDIRVISSFERGVSRNRNLLLDHATGDVLLVTDDDLIYTPERLQTVIRKFKENTAIDLALFRYEGADVKRYPERECIITEHLPKGYYVTTFEIALRRNSVAGRHRFDERFGPGSEYLHCGEETMFLQQLLHRGVNAMFFPVTITCHEGLTTGNRPQTPGTVRTNGALIRLMYPLSWPLRVLLKAYRLNRVGQYTFGKAVKDMLAGIYYAENNRIRL